MFAKQMGLFAVGMSLLVKSYTDTSIPSINEIMSVEDQQKTGVINLTQKQKMELARWLVQHGYHQPSDEILYAPTVSLNIHEGKMLQLSDNSVWDISPDDVRISQKWISPVPVKITMTPNVQYPYLITNLNTQESVKARKGNPNLPAQ